MSPACEPQPTRALTLTADELNEAIRALMRRAYGRPLWPAEAAEYEQLLLEWAAATRAEMVTAA